MELRIENLSKRYPNGIQALKNVSLSISEGMFGLLGPNGAGKSTLMRILATLQEADSGSARLGDLDVLKEKDLVRKLLGYLPQEFGLYPKVSALDMLDHFALLKGITLRNDRREIVKALLQKTNLYEVRRRRLGTFSGGMKQRFGIAQALLGNPKLIIVDEPTAGLDPEERARFLDLLTEIGDQIIVILSTHIVNDVSDLCHQMAMIHQGEVILNGDPLQLIEGARGRVWRKAIPKSELANYRTNFPVISVRLWSGKTWIHVTSDDCPDPSFEAANPNLEDVYLWTMKYRRAQPPPLPHSFESVESH